MYEAETTYLLKCFSEGDSSVKDELLRRIYDSLVIRARSLARGAELPMLETGVLINELYLRLDRLASQELKNRTHFLAVAATCMRNLCRDFARAEAARSRRQCETSKGEMAPEPTGDERMLELERALSELDGLHHRQVRVVEMKFFADMSHQEIAQALDVSPETVKKDWHMAKAFLGTRLAGSATP